MYPEKPQVVEIDDDGIDLRGLLLTLWRGKWIIAVCCVVTGVLGILAVSQTQPSFTATAKVMFQPPQMNIVDLQEVLAAPELGRDGLNTQIEVLRSTRLIERVAMRLGLESDPAFNPALRVETPSFFARLTGSVSVSGALRDAMVTLGITPPPQIGPVDPDAEARQLALAIVERVRAGLRLRPVPNSRVIDITFTASNPRTAARIVNAMSEEYITDQLDAKLEATRSATEWLSTRVLELQDRVQEAEEAVEAARAALAIEAGQSVSITRQQLEALNASLAGANAATSQRQSRYERIVGALEGDVDFGTITEFRDSAIIQRLRAEQGELMPQRGLLVASVGPDHPALRRLDVRIAEVSEAIRVEAGRVAEAARNDLEAARAEERALAQQVRELERRALEQAQDEVELRQLEREAQASRILYENFLSRLKETSAQQDLQTADARVLSPAEPPKFADNANKKRTVILATFGGGLLGIGVIFLLERLNNTFRAVPELEQQAGLPVLATLPSLGGRQRRADVVRNLREKPSGPLAEAVRNLRTSILFSNLDQPPQVVMFTSSAPREGKSTTSMLMALTSQQMGKSAIIVDCDLRLPAIASLTDAEDQSGAGLMALLEGAADIEAALYRDPATGLHMLMTRQAERRAQISAADILASQRFRALVDTLKQRYDLVILDTPPTLVVTDARIVASLADAVVYAVRWDVTPRGAVLEGLRELRSVQAPIAGIAMTMVNEGKAARYAYQNYGYYKGRYRDYYST